MWDAKGSHGPTAAPQPEPASATGALFPDSLGWPEVVSRPVSKSLKFVVTAPTVEEPP